MMEGRGAPFASPAQDRDAIGGTHPSGASGSPARRATGLNSWTTTSEILPYPGETSAADPSRPATPKARPAGKGACRVRFGPPASLAGSDPSDPGKGVRAA